MRHPLAPRKQPGPQPNVERLLVAFVVLGLAAVALAALPGAVSHGAGRSDEHGTMLLGFEETADGCDVFVEARHVETEHATLQVLTGGDVHEEELVGDPEDEHGHHHDAGPFSVEVPADPHRFILRLDTEEFHSLHALWSGEECASDAYLRVHEDAESGAVLTVAGCSLFVEGRHIRESEGHVQVDGEGQVHTLAVPEEAMEVDEWGHRFFVGPIEVDHSGAYGVRFFSGDEQVTPRSPAFTVDGCGVTLSATPHTDESVTVTAHHLDTSAVLLRAEAGGTFEHAADMDPENDTYHDNTTQAGITYTYRLVIDDEVVDEIGVTAIPVFPTVVARAFALAAGLGGYMLMRRRR